jgi:hypothetical protein
MKWALLLALAACNPFLAQQSVAPPGRTARLDEVTGFWGTVKSYRLELSRGVAIAINCTRGGPCEHLHITSDDPSIAEVRPAALGVLERAGLMNQQTSSALVVVGKAPGTTRVHIVAEEGRRDIAVTIVATPNPTVSRVATP